jgi:hypothetical protein
MTQAEYDDKVNAIADHSIRLAYKSAKLRRRYDPAVYWREAEIIFLQNILFSLSYYDVDSGLFTDTELRDLFALATQVIQYCPS